MGLKSSFGLLCVILVITATKGQQQQKTVNTSNSTDTLLAALKAFIPNFEGARLDKDVIAVSCPQLWDPAKRTVFNSSAGFLGSLQEIDTFCEQEQPICGFAKWMSNYLCNASLALQDGDGFPSPPPFKDFPNLQNMSRLCGELSSKDLKNNITNAIRAANNPNAEKLVSFFNNLYNILTGNCMKSCPGKNLRACQVVLQGLRTIGTWEELKQRLMLEANDKAVDVPATTARPDNSTSVPLVKLSSNVSEIVQPKNKTDETTTVEETTPTTTKATTVSASSNSTTTTTMTTVAAAELPDEGEEDIPVAESPLGENVEELRPDQNADDKEEDYEDKDDAEKGMDDDIIDEKKTTQGDLETSNEQGAKMPKNPYSEEPEDTHFIVYFLVCLVLIVLGYVLYHRRTRVVALIIEGRRGGSSGRRRQGSVRGRPSSSASYKRLDNNLEEVVTSSRAVKSSNVIY